MLYQIGEALPAEGFFTASKQGKTGLTVTVDVYNPTRTKIVTDGAATEVGGGLYTYSAASNLNDRAGNYRFVFKTSDSTVDRQHVPALCVVGEPWVERVDVASSSRLAASSYTAPDNSGITAIKAKTDNLPADPASNTQVATRLATSGYTAPDNAAIALIKAVTDKISTMLAAIGLNWQFTSEALDNVPSETAIISDADKTDIAQRVFDPDYVSERTLTSYTGITVISPVTTAGDLNIVPGDDYYEADGRGISWTSTGWPSLAGATVVFRFAGQEVACTATGTSTQTVKLDLPRAVTSLFTGDGTFTVRATLANGHQADIITGMVLV